MGPAVFSGLVLIALLLIGFTIYGTFLGLGTLGRQIRRMWHQVNSFYPEPALAPERDSPTTCQPEERPRCGCWEIKGCPESVRESCPAHQRPDLPCWLANMQSTEDYRLKPECIACELFSIPALMTGV